MGTGEYKDKGGNVKERKRNRPEIVNKPIINLFVWGIKLLY